MFHQNYPYFVADREIIKSPNQQQNHIQLPENNLRKINRREFLRFTSFGSVGLVASVVAHKILANQFFTPISVAKPKYTPPNQAKASELPLWTVEFETVKVDKRGVIVKRYSQKAKFFKENLGHDVSLEMIKIPGGTFTMGVANNEESSNDNERPQHQVTIQPFFIGRYLITQKQWERVATSFPQVQSNLNPKPSYFKGDNHPVESISLNNALEFCARLSQKTGRNYRLPSEAEWEYACRAGTSTPFHFGETITAELANYNSHTIYNQAPKGNYQQQTTPVGSYPPNAFGLHDMHGNVREWCADAWHSSYQGATTDGSMWSNNHEQQNFIVRGGWWSSPAAYCRSAQRGASAVDHINGLRVVCAVTV
ncbi:MAG: formylglycine-generating enzyme family protein [Desmonostoc vinosum HA7617-LM4]|jgi:formylglycine-generating enzyme required for sulfatase activity|nr:formylglycine-generating enzyme family protein [Desmonostoc vinosum HA7617-LM4]